ncbi:PPE domain-containing protein [Saccharothrix sp. NRRL B-16314]|uniref:PPE domain-containing protein n=1 Tax=Saccharothrix sp. NRRL B-16314 TaxID=1463825 RepID=UPI0005257FA7|nr:PPE domain-containing protein [Saccharothrix sp. NRRL B-16314]
MPDGHRWSGYSHEELYRQINSGPGPKASHASMERWQGVSTALTEINAELLAGVQRSGATWEGSAADHARSGLNPLAAWADDARTGAEVMRISAELQADYISKARSDMPPPVKVTAEEPNLLVSALTNLVGGQTDYEKQEKAQNAAEQRAREVMTTYASSTVSNTTTLGQFHQPPQLVISAGDVVRNDSAGVSQPGWAYGGPRGGRGGGGGGGWRRGGRGGMPMWRPPVSSGSGSYAGGGSTGTSSAAPVASTRPSTAAVVPAGPSSAAFGTGGVIGGAGRSDKERRGSSSSGSSGSSGSSASSDTTSGQNAAAQHVLSGGTSSSSGTTSVSSAEFGAFAAANAQHAATAAPGGSTGALAGGQVGGGDTVHKRSTPAPVAPAFDPFGGLGGPRGGDDEEDATHDAADYLRETDDIYGVGGTISPAVIGESTTH